MDMSAIKLLAKALLMPSDRLWIDGRAVTASTEMIITRKPADAFPENRLCPSNPDRVALGFLLANTGAGGDSISPFADVTTFSIAQLSPGVLLWYKLTDYPSLLANAWYINPAGPEEMLVIDVLTLRRLHDV